MSLRDTARCFIFQRAGEVKNTASFYFSCVLAETNPGMFSLTGRLDV